MAFRNILDYQGNIVGQLELPDNTLEEVWAAKLAVYAKPPPPKIIAAVTPRQMRSALLLMGITESMILTAINSLPSPNKDLALIAWEYSTAFERNNSLTALVAADLGWSSDQLDQLWYFAVTL